MFFSLLFFVCSFILFPVFFSLYFYVLFFFLFSLFFIFFAFHKLFHQLFLFQRTYPTNSFFFRICLQLKKCHFFKIHSCLQNFSKIFLNTFCIRFHNRLQECLCIFLPAPQKICLICSFQYHLSTSLTGIFSHTIQVEQPPERGGSLLD